MNILDKFTHKQPSGPNQDNLPAKAKMLITELVKPLEKPDQEIINDLMTLIVALSSKPHPNINVNQVLKTSQTLIHQLVSPIPSPNQHLIDELLNTIVQSAKQSKDGNSDQQTSQQATKNKEHPQETSTPAKQEPEKQGDQKQASPKQDAPAQQDPAPKTAHHKQTKEDQDDAQTEKRMLNILMDQIKELVTITNSLNQKQKDLNQQTNNRIDTMNEDIDNLKKRTEGIEKELKMIQQSMDKFIGLYEVVTNQYNPFVEEDSDGKAPSPPPETKEDNKEESPKELSTDSKEK